MNKEIFDVVQGIVKQLEIQAELTDERRSLFEQFLEIFPTYPPIWIQYIKEERQCTDDEANTRVMRLYYRSLPNTPDVNLFMDYIDFVQSTSYDRLQICQAYEYALSKVGRDMNAIRLYSDYANLAENSPGVPIDRLRRVYQRALLVPMEGLQEFFKNYRDFENRKSTNLAATLLPDQERHFKATATVYHTKKRYHKQLQHMLCTMDEGGFCLLHQWRLFIEYEKTNPLNANPDVHREYVEYAYNSALTTLRYVPLLWLEYGQALIEFGDINAAIEVYHKAINTLPDNLMLNFTFAELLESNKRSPEAYETYRNLILRSENNISHLTLATIQFLKFLQRTGGPVAMRQEFVACIEANKCTYHLYLAIAAMENAVNVDRDAALQILMFGFESHGNEFEFVENMIKLLIKMDADDEIMEIMRRTKDNKDFPPDKVMELYKLLFEHFLYKREKEDLLEEVEKELLKDPKETPNRMNLRKYFLPLDYKDE
ncbi:cleavage stimulation factor subunit 77 [Histomonas meleagridis]|uniref:cleavage stimulation factor subunit 77 n=1 Tax=Histomonas meleagridis TaxID=135588 RepID=UPI003559DB6E|nr:cleavage stimulation factor subunit 77 [Histomonas meleagridis]KAH0800649.1 cleavage stimulation factor subunit 77 [Histomonas meleagridis]